MNKRLFITGIPTGGKSYLAAKFARDVGGVHVSFDDLRDTHRHDERYRSWISFYWNQDERTYYTNTPPEEQWNNLVQQSECLWPLLLEEAARLESEPRAVIFEGVNILPHLAYRDLPFGGACLIGDALATVRQRVEDEPRWGKTQELKDLEAEAFFNIERPRYKTEAEKYGIPVFQSADDAYKQLLAGLLGNVL